MMKLKPKWSGDVLIDKKFVLILIFVVTICVAVAVPLTRMHYYFCETNNQIALSAELIINSIIDLLIAFGGGTNTTGSLRC